MLLGNRAVRLSLVVLGVCAFVVIGLVPAGEASVLGRQSAVKANPSNVQNTNGAGKEVVSGVGKDLQLEVADKDSSGGAAVGTVQDVQSINGVQRNLPPQKLSKVIRMGRTVNTLKAIKHTRNLPPVYKIQKESDEESESGQIQTEAR